MLPCRSAAGVVSRKGVLCQLQTPIVGPSNWQKQSSCGFSTRKVRPKIARKKQSQLDISERQTLQEIRQLKISLEELKKNEEAQRSRTGLEEINEEMLDTIYEALQAPDPPLEEEIRLEARRRRNRQRRLIRGETKSFTDTMYGRKVIERLGRLSRRLAEFHNASQFEGDPKISAYEKTSFLLTRLGVDEAMNEAQEDNVVIQEDEYRAEGVAIFNEVQSLQSTLDQLESISMTLTRRVPDRETSENLVLPLGIATTQEWESLCASFAYHNDAERVKKTLEAVRRSGQSSSLTKAANAALDIYASQGATRECQELINWMAQNEIQVDDYTNHCLVKSFVYADDFNQVFSVLHQLEDQQPASLGTYTFVMGALLKQKNDPALQQMIWPLFTRMRLVAHPAPDAPCYAKLIRACSLGIAQPNDSFWKPASDSRSQVNDAIQSIHKPGKDVVEAERALDLFREMTDRYGIRPNSEVYSALISACAKRKDMYQKALQLFKNMIELERSRVDAINQKIKGVEDSPSYAPTREVFNAILSGCARNADLTRARWILAEMLRSAAVRWKEIMSQKGEGAILAQWEVQEFEDRLPDAETLSKVFYTYASYKPTPQTIKTNKQVGSQSSAATSIMSHQDASGEERQSLVEEDALKKGDESTLSHILPRTRKALVAEANALMERIKVDFKAQSGLLSVITPDTSLINSYLAVLSRHADKDDARYQIEVAVFGQNRSNQQEEEVPSLFDYFKVKMNGHTCEVVLEACCRIEKGNDVYNLANKVWSNWLNFSQDQADATNKENTSTTISRIWSAMIQVLAKNQRLDESMHLLRQFAQLHPPRPSSESNTSNLIFTSTRPLLLPDQDSIKVSNPILTFKQMEKLHLRLVESENRREDIKYLTWLIKSYEYSVKPKKPISLRDIFTSSNRQEAIRRLLSQGDQDIRNRSMINVE